MGAGQRPPVHRLPERLGPPPLSGKPWKAVIAGPDRAGFLDAYFRELRSMPTLGAKLAAAYGREAKNIRTTVFGVRAKGRGYEFYVMDQTYK